MHTDFVLSTGQLVFMAVVVTASLAAWLIAVLLAARQPHGTSAAKNARPPEQDAVAAAVPPQRGAGPSDKTAA
jgi:hypothetical protein